MITENLLTLKIHNLSQAQYERELRNGTLDPNALYLTPKEEIDLTPYAIKSEVSSTYETKTDASNKLTEAKTYADNIKDDLLNGAGEAYDSLKELGELIDDNTDAIDALNTVAASKANASDLTSHISNKNNPHEVTAAQVGLGNVPNVATNDQTPTYTQASTLATLTSGEKLSVSFGKIMKAISDFISHIGNKSNPHEVTLSQLGVTATATELNYVDGVTSNIQTQLNGKASNNVATTSTNGLMSATDKAKLDATNVAYATCDTAAATAAKVVTVSGNDNWELVVGSIIMVKFSISNTASNVTLNVNNTGAYPIWYNSEEYTGTGTAYTGYANRTTTYMFNGTHWVWVSNSYDANTQSNTNSTNTSSKIFLIGATSQGSSKTTYSHDTAYVGTNGHVYSNSKQVVNLSDSQTLTNKSLASPTLTGTPTAPTAAAGTNTTQIATTAFVNNAISDINTISAITIPAGRIRGDINGDGVADKKDAELIHNEPYYNKNLNNLFPDGNIPLDYLAADIDGNGNINVSDWNLLTNAGFKAGKYPEITGNWTNNPNYATEESQFYIDIPIEGMTSSSSASIIIKGEFEKGFFTKAECIDGAIRIHSKGCPTSETTAIVSWGSGNGTAIIISEPKLDSDIFIATYGTTTYDEVYAAYYSGKSVKVLKNSTYYDLIYDEGETFIFSYNQLNVSYDESWEYVVQATVKEGIIGCSKYVEWYTSAVGNGVNSRILYPPTTHASSHAIGGSDPITPESIGAAPMYDYGTEDLIAGTSPLETGKLYFVYE